MTQAIELTLSTDIVSVDGVVNGERYAFALTGSIDNMHIWTAEVPRSADSIYRVTISVVYGRERNTTQYSTILYYGIYLITDRTQFDVDRVKNLSKKGWANLTAEERAEWEAGLKGAYNAIDLNRVQGAMRYLQARFADLGYNVELSEAKTWMKSDCPTIAELNNYLADIRAIRGVVTLLNTTPPAPDTMVRFNYQKANDIEQILFDVDELLTYMAASMVYSGDFYGGEYP